MMMSTISILNQTGHERKMAKRTPELTLTRLNSPFTTHRPPKPSHITLCFPRCFRTRPKFSSLFLNLGISIISTSSSGSTTLENRPDSCVSGWPRRDGKSALDTRGLCDDGPEEGAAVRAEEGAKTGWRCWRYEGVRGAGGGGRRKVTEL